MQQSLSYALYPSPVGDLALAFYEGRLCHLDFGDPSARMEKLLKRRFKSYSLVRTEAPDEVIERLNRYFGGDRGAFADLPLETGGTPFQREVWAALKTIPYGETLSYAELAARIGKPSATRAVARANALNPISIVIPCHRVIGKDGSLTGYGGGIEIKRALLEREGAIK